MAAPELPAGVDQELAGLRKKGDEVAAGERDPARDQHVFRHPVGGPWGSSTNTGMHAGSSPCSGNERSPRPPSTADTSAHCAQVRRSQARDLANRNFTASAPDRLWMTDLALAPTDDGCYGSPRSVMLARAMSSPRRGGGAPICSATA